MSWFKMAAVLLGQYLHFFPVRYIYRKHNNLRASILSVENGKVA